MSKSTIVMPKGVWYLHLVLHFHQNFTIAFSKHTLTLIPDLQLQIQTEETTSTTHNECLKRKPTHPPIQLHPHQSTSTNPSQKQVLKASFPSGFISMAPAADTDTASLASNATSSKSLSHSGPVNAGNDTYNFYDGDGGDGWPGMEQWVDFYSM